MPVASYSYIDNREGEVSVGLGSLIRSTGVGSPIIILRDWVILIKNRLGTYGLLARLVGLGPQLDHILGNRL